MLSEERSAKIIEILETKNFIRIPEMMAEFGVSHETARKDLEALQEKGIAKRVYGGAVYTPQPVITGTGNIPDSVSENQVVAEVASKLVKPGMSVYIGNGLTMKYVASNLKNVKDISIVTVNLLAVNELSSSEDIDLYLLGGKVYTGEFFTTGAQTERNFVKYNYDIAFRSCAGLNLTNGSVLEYDDFGIPGETIRSYSKKFVLVLNSKKLNKDCFSNFFSLRDVDTVVVDSNISPEDLETLKNYGVEVIVAPMNDNI